MIIIIIIIGDNEWHPKFIYWHEKLSVVKLSAVYCGRDYVCACLFVD